MTYMKMFIWAYLQVIIPKGSLSFVRSHCSQTLQVYLWSTTSIQIIAF